MTLAEWVKAVRGLAGLTQAELGERLARGKANVSSWERGAHEPSYSQVLAIAAIGDWRLVPPGIDPAVAPGTGIGLHAVAHPPTDAWPFPSIPPARYAALPQATRDDIEEAVALRVKQAERAPPRKSASG